MDNEKKPRTMELPKPEQTACPYETEYACDVLVVGCGFAGLNAAWAAAEGGAAVLVVDKGKPGYSGLSPWPSSFRWFDPERGDKAEAYRRAMQEGGDYISNLEWYECWIRESAKIYHRLSDWGILKQYPRGAEAGDYYEREDFVGYREVFDKFDRHKKWTQVLKKYGIPWLEHTMAVQVLTDEGRVAGLLAFHVPSGTPILIRAKAVVLATGGGSYKPSGYPTGGDTFDGEYMAYQMGLPIAGKEFEDFHMTPGSAPGNVFLDNHWQYLENIWLCGGDITEENATVYAASKAKAMMLGRVQKAVEGVPATDGSEMQDVSKAQFTRRGGSVAYAEDPEEVRSGKMSTPTGQSLLGGAAVGMCCHLTSGVFCGLHELDGAAGIPGLYTAGDGIHATIPSGAAYPCGVGFTSCFTSIDGEHAGGAAAAYAAGAEQAEPDGDSLRAAMEELEAPLKIEKGFDPNWARDVLHSIMAPYWVNVAKTEPTLRAALTQVEYMRDHVAPKLMAGNGHDLRLALEMKHKILSAEMKLRASLERKESRGSHYRSDYPYRNDGEFLCYITLQKDAGGNMELKRVAVPEEWTGDTDLPYEKRYHYYFPGEREAMGLGPEAPGAGKWGK